MTYDNILLTIDNKEPVPVRVLGDVLAAIGDDYRDQYGRDLVVEEVRQGSILVYLKDLADSADAVNHLVDFVKNIGWVRDLLTSSNGQKGVRSKGAKTVKAIANAALRSGSEVYIEHQSADGEKLLVHVNPSDAAIILRPRRRESLAPSRAAASMVGTESPHDRFLEDLARAAADLSPGTVAAIGDDSNVQLQLLKEFVRTIRAREDGEEWISRIARNLRDRGHRGAAELLEDL